MKLLSKCILALVFGCEAVAVAAQLGVVSNVQPQSVFSGAATIPVTVCNRGNESSSADIHARLIQTSSATAVNVSDVPWKTLQVLPHQTVLDSARLDFPSVKAETKFIVQWLQETNVIGKTEVKVYPTNLLTQLKALAGDEPLGVFDPANIVKPLLKGEKLECVNLENSSLGNFSGKLAIVGPFTAKEQVHESLVADAKALVKKGVAVVWMQPPPAERQELQPSFYVASATNSAVVVVQPELVANLAESPRSQLNLIYFCKLAVDPARQHLSFDFTSTRL